MQKKPSEIDLEAENLVLQLAYWSRLLITKRFGRPLHSAYHGRWTTNKDLNVRCWSRKPSFDHVCCNESCPSVPLLWRVVQHVEDTEPVILLCQPIKIFLKQSVIWIDVCKDQINSSSVPPAIMPRDRHIFGLYTMAPFGPFTFIVSPIRKVAICAEILPRGYVLIIRSK